MDVHPRAYIRCERLLSHSQRPLAQRSHSRRRDEDCKPCWPLIVGTVENIPADSGGPASASQKGNRDVPRPVGRLVYPSLAPTACPSLTWPDYYCHLPVTHSILYPCAGPCPYARLFTTRSMCRAIVGCPAVQNNHSAPGRCRTPGGSK